MLQGIKHIEQAVKYDNESSFCSVNKLQDCMKWPSSITWMVVMS